MTEGVATTGSGGLHEAAAVLAWYSPPAITPVPGPPGDLDLLLLDSDVTVDAALQRRWTLGTDVRVQVLRRLRQQGRILDALAANPQRPAEPIQVFLELYLTGRRPAIDELDLPALVCVRTVCDWLRPAGFDDLPDPGSLAARLEWLLLLQPVEALAAGRQPDDGEHLRVLRDLVHPTPGSTLAVLDGGGGSVAAARFLLDRARAGLPIAYLDLSRPDVRPPTLPPVLLETARQILAQRPRAADRCAPILLDWERRLASPGGITDEEARGWSDDLATIIDAAGLTRTPVLLVLDETRQAYGLSRTVAQLRRSLPQLRICLCRRRAGRDTARSGGLRDLPPASDVFVGRDLTQLSRRLPAAVGVVVGQASVFGFGGIGKTELALRYALEHAGRYRQVCWVSAGTADKVRLGLATFARRLGPAGTLADAQAWAVGWLRSNSNWLLVLDDVEDVEDVAELLGDVAGRGHVVVTTRRDPGLARWASLGLAPLSLGVLDRPASVELLVALTGLPATAGAGRLAAQLGDLPLALEQAGAYIRQHDGLTFEQYWSLLRGELALDAYDNAADPAAAAPLHLTLNAVRSRSVLADRVMRVLAWMAPDAVPEDVLMALSEHPADLDEALTLLTSYKMVTWNAGTVRVHRLVQAVIRAETPGGGLDEAVRVLTAALPAEPIDTVDSWQRWDALLPHLDAVLSHLPAVHTNVGALRIAGGAANYRRLQGHAAEAAAAFEQLLIGYVRVFGEDHPEVLTTRHNLAIAYWAAERTGDAVVVWEQVLAGRRRLFGDDHPDVLTTLSNLAVARWDAERIEDAVAALEQVLAGRRRLLGDDHPDVLTTLSNLATAYWDAERIEEAVAVWEQVLPGRRRQFGDDHPGALIARYNLAVAYWRVGRVGEAIAMDEQLLPLAEQVLGVNSPLVDAVRRRLAEMRAATGDA
ncbi:tetratricopeptide repeat protein [Dactylosporangium sp. NPDC006015]|uniref:tetratricopeptide repeat protein n=1 Tax=Dactylosporangium sp. NPDC006015 TaxID=3154576 RepID=UPI00339EA825